MLHLRCATVLMCTLVVDADDCGVTWHDSLHLDQLPIAIQQQITSVVERSDASGIERDFADILLQAIPRGMSFRACCEMYNGVQRVSQARRELGHYDAMLDPRTNKWVQVCAVCWAWCMCVQQVSFPAVSSHNTS